MNRKLPRGGLLSLTERPISRFIAHTKRDRFAALFLLTDARLALASRGLFKLWCHATVRCSLARASARGSLG